MKEYAESEKELAKDLLNKLKQMQDRRKPYEDVYESVTELILPRLADWSISEPKVAKDLGKKLYTSAGKSALRLARDGLQGYLTPRSAPWFAVQLRSKIPGITSDEIMAIPEIRKWSQDCTEGLYSALNRSNFYDQQGAVLDNGLVIGTSTLFIENDIGRERARFKVPHPKDVFIAEDEYGVVDTWALVSWKTGKQILEEYDEKELPNNVVKQLENEPFKSRKVVQFIYPRKSRIIKSLRADQAPWASVHIYADTQEIIKNSGFQYNPGTTWRYRVNAGEEYGYSPGMDALVDLERLNEVARTDLRGRQLAVEPPVWYPQRLKGQLNLKPRGMNPYINPAERIEPIQLSNGIQLGYEQEKILTDAIRDQFNAEFFLMISMIDQKKTATEVWEIAGEKAAIMGATVGRIESELLDPILNTLFALELDSGRLPPPPDVVFEMDVDFEFDYIFPLAMLQEKHFGQQGTVQSLNMLAPIAEFFGPGVLDNLDGDVMFRAAASKARVEADAFITEEERDKRREAAAARAAEEMEAQNMEQKSKAYKNMNEVPVPQSPAEQLITRK